MVLLASEKMQSKAEDVLKEDIDKQPIYSQVDKILSGSKDVETLNFQIPESDDGGMMLYTSGTTNRPVSLEG